MMRRSNWMPSIVPSNDQTVYLVADDFGPNGRAWRETELEATDLETVIDGLLAREFSNSIRVVAFNTAEHWSQDVCEDIAHEIQRRSDLQLTNFSSRLESFVERHAGRHRRQLTLRLV